MAKLGSYYGLCPLIDQHSLLGISEDADPGHVVVTLGKNIAVKYKLADQKQIKSWRTKDKFSSPVVFDKEGNKYVAIFNQTNLRMWDDAEENLDKLKKYKFNKPIHTILNCGGNLFVVFQNGGVLPLKTALNDRKNIVIENVIDISSEEITDIVNVITDTNNLIYIGILVKAQDSRALLWTVFINGTAYNQFEKISLNRDNEILSGYVLCQTFDKHINFFTLWSDGKLFSCSLTGNHSQEKSTDEINSYGVPYANIESVCCQQFITMTMVNSDYIAIYGAENNQEGAALVLYNLQFKVSQSKQTFKLFSNIAKIWCIESNLLLCVGQNLAIVPFYLNTEQLAALVGSHAVVLNEKDPDVTIVQDVKIGQWDCGDDNNYIEDNINYGESIPLRIKSSVMELFQQGLSEAIICEHLIPLYIENEDIESILNCAAYFCDIPEACIVQLIQFGLNANEKIFNNTAKSVNIDSLYPKERCNLIDTILALPCNDVLLVPYIRKELDVVSTLLLLQHITHVMSVDGHCLPALDVVATETKLIEWSCVLLDASYQKFLLTRDENINSVLNKFRYLIQDHLNYLEDINQMSPWLNQLNKDTSLNKNKLKAGQGYSIEQLSLY